MLVCFRSQRPLPVDTRQTVITGCPIIAGKTRIPSKTGFDIPVGSGIDEISAHKRMNTSITVFFYAKGKGIGSSALSLFPIPVFMKPGDIDAGKGSNAESFPN